MPPEYKHVYGAVNSHGYLTAYNHVCSLSGMKYGERLRKARKYAHLTQAKLATLAGVTQPNISDLENGDAEGSMYTVQFAETCGVDAYWLATGQGEMTGAYVVRRSNLIALLHAAESLPEYAVNRAIKEVAAIEELIERARRGNGET